jgi:hypothetical protein
MKTAKQEAIELLDSLPDDVPMETIMEGLHFKARVLHAVGQIDRGEGISHEDAKQRLSKWLESSGRPTRSTA